MHVMLRSTSFLIAVLFALTKVTESAVPEVQSKKHRQAEGQALESEKQEGFERKLHGGGGGLARLPVRCP